MCAKREFAEQIRERQCNTMDFMESKFAKLSRCGLGVGAESYLSPGLLPGTVQRTIVKLCVCFY